MDHAGGGHAVVEGEEGTCYPCHKSCYGEGYPTVEFDVYAYEGNPLGILSHGSQDETEGGEGETPHKEGAQKADH